MSIILRMKFRMFLLGLLVSSGFLVLAIIQTFLGWLNAEEIPIMVEENIEEVISREVEQAVNNDWKGPVAYPNIPVMVWWTPFTGDDGLQECGEYKCYFTNDRQFRNHPNLRSIFFYGTDFKPSDTPLPRRPNEDWALFHEESPKNNPIFNHEDVMKMFNHSATFRRTSDFPLTTQYLHSLDQITDPTFLIPLNVKNRMMAEGLAPIAYVQSGCETPSERDKFVVELMKHIRVDSYGECLHNKDLPEEIRGSEKLDHKEYLYLLAKYKYVIAAENAVCDDYVTEKLWKPLQVGAVPIYLGAPNIEEYLPNANSAILVKDFSSASDLADYINKLNQDDALYKTYLGHKLAHNVDSSSLITNQLIQEMMLDRKWGVTSKQQRTMGNFVKHFQCFVCNRVARNIKFVNLGFNALPFSVDASHYGCPVPMAQFSDSLNMKSWWVEKWFRAKHEAKVLRKFAEQKEPFTGEQFASAVLNEIQNAKN